MSNVGKRGKLKLETRLRAALLNGTNTRLEHHEIERVIQALSKPQAREDAQPFHAFAERVFKAGHADGWSGNQTRRAAAHADAQEGWERYVRNGALGKSLATVDFHPAPDALRVAVEALEGAKQIAARLDGHDAGMMEDEIEAIDQALAALQAEQKGGA